MGIHLHRARRADYLADALAELLATPPSDPFAVDIVAVPTRGVERFLSQRLALHLGARQGRPDGVCANVKFPSPGELFAGLFRELSGGPSQGTSCQTDMTLDRQLNAWQPQPLTWAIARILPDLAAHPECQALTKHLCGPSGGALAGNLLATAGRAARLLCQYQDERPQMVASWSTCPPDVPTDLRWQVTIWQELVQRLGPGPALTLPHLVTRLQNDPDSCGLPQRLSLFGPTRLSVTSLQMLEALGRHREVHLWLVDPSPAGWGTLARHPLVSSAGRDFAGLGVRLRDLKHSDDCRPTPTPSNTLLGHLQADIAANAAPRRRTIDPSDNSLQIHACHGSARQVEVSREVILGLLDGDPTLEPRDILVMCPDLDTFAPLFSAAFAAKPGDPTLTDLRLRIADRTPEQANEVLAALAQALEILSGRVTIGAVLDLLASPAVSRRFEIDEEGLSRLQELAQAAGVYWGLDSNTRSRYGLAGIDVGTWAFGLDRILLGVALGEDELSTFGGVLPLDDVGSSDVELVGALAALVALLRAGQEWLAEMHPLDSWVQMLTDLVRALTAPPRDAQWMAGHAETVLRAPLQASADSLGVHPPQSNVRTNTSDGNVEPASATAELDGRPVAADKPVLSFGDIRWLLGEALAGRPTRANFRTGGLTVAGLMPMRSVPHRVIVLVGLDDGTFPRADTPDGDDLLGRHPLPGERNARSEDRQLFLDAIMAAEEHLIITYCGADDRTNEARPPAVPVAELLDVLGAMVDNPTGRATRSGLVTSHPLQPFDPRNFICGALVPGRAFSHDRSALAGAIAASGKRLAPEPFLPAPLPAPTLPDEVTIASLSKFLADPLAYFLSARLGLPTSGHEEPAPERLPVPLSSLAAWAVGDRLLDGLRHGHRPEVLAEVERLRGALPPGELGKAEIMTIGPKAGRVYDQVLAFSRGPVDMVRVNLRLPNGVRLTGTVPDTVMPTNPVAAQAACAPALVLRSSYSRFKPGKLLSLWVDVLAAQLCRPELRLAGVLVAQDGTHALAAPAPNVCADHLARLCDLMTAGLREPLPMPPSSALEYATARARGRSPELATKIAAGNWASRFGGASEPAAQRIFGSNAEMSVLTCGKPGDHEAVPGEDNRFGALARLVWDPILAAAVDVESLASGGSL